MTRQDKTRQDKTRQDKTRQDKTRQDKTRQDDIMRNLRSTIKRSCKGDHGAMEKLMSKSNDAQ